MPPAYDWSPNPYLSPSPWFNEPVQDAISPTIKIEQSDDLTVHPETQLRSTTNSEDDVNNPPIKTELSKRPRPGRIIAVKQVFGYPSSSDPVPTHLSCFEVCQHYPNSLYGEVLDAFLQWNFSDQQIYDILPRDVQQAMTANHKQGNKNVANAIAKRISKRRDRLRKAGEWDGLMSDPKIRESGIEGFRGNAKALKVGRRTSRADSRARTPRSMSSTAGAGQLATPAPSDTSVQELSRYTRQPLTPPTEGYAGTDCTPTTFPRTDPCHIEDKHQTFTPTPTPVSSTHAWVRHVDYELQNMPPYHYSTSLDPIEELLDASSRLHPTARVESHTLIGDQQHENPGAHHALNTLFQQIDSFDPHQDQSRQQVGYQSFPTTGTPMYTRYPDPTQYHTHIPPWHEYHQRPSNISHQPRQQPIQPPTQRRYGGNGWVVGTAERDWHHRSTAQYHGDGAEPRFGEDTNMTDVVNDALDPYLRPF